MKMSTSRKEEERNEKIIRGLMKLPPNRRCINCNNLGPQYVCTNFWTFVCTVCSGIHREFTHRVKSVSMAKFTSQEVDALQKGGNQRAREIFLKDWDTQRQRLPNSGNVDKIRDFIRNVYVDKKYAGGKSSDKPPRDMQSNKNNEDDVRRASSYHSYSQSPPYENQYEDRRYGRQGGVFSRKPGSDRGHYEGKISSFGFSPGRLVEQMYEDRFANEGSIARVSDYSASSAGDPFRSDTQSPNFRKDVGFSSSPTRPVRDILVEDARRPKNNSYSESTAKRDRTASSGSFGSFDGNSMSLKTVNSDSLLDLVSEPEQPTVIKQACVSPFASLQSSASAGAVNQDQPKPSYIQPLETSSASTIDLFADFNSVIHEPGISPLPSTQPSTVTTVNWDPFNQSFIQPPASSSDSSIGLFAEVTHERSSATSIDLKSPTDPFSENVGWATFDLNVQAASSSETKHEPSASVSSGNEVTRKDLPTLPSVTNSMQSSLVRSSTAPVSYPLLTNQWHGSSHEVQTSTVTKSSQSWNAFEDPILNPSQSSFSNLTLKTESQIPVYLPLTSADHFESSKVLKDLSEIGLRRSTVEDHVNSMPFNSVIADSSFPPSVFLKDGTLSHDKKSTNPFDLPCNSDTEPTMLLDMSSLQTAIPNSPLPASFLSCITEPWFHQSSSTPYIDAVPKGGLAYIAGKAPASQLTNIPSQGPVASLGGNPFA